MNRLGIIGRLGAVLLSTMAHGGWPAEIAQGQRGSGKSRAAATVASHRFKNMGRPTAARRWHDLDEPGQCETLQAAKDKRERKADKLYRQAAWSARGNDAHFLNGAMPTRLNPFHVAH